MTSSNRYIDCNARHLRCCCWWNVMLEILSLFAFQTVSLTTASVKVWSFSSKKEVIFSVSVCWSDCQQSCQLTVNSQCMICIIFGGGMPGEEKWLAEFWEIIWIWFRFRFITMIAWMLKITKFEITYKINSKVQIHYRLQYDTVVQSVLSDGRAG